MVLRHAGLDVRGRLYDTMIIHYLLDPESRHGMDYLATTFLNYTPIPIEELIGKGARPNHDGPRSNRKGLRICGGRCGRNPAAETPPVAYAREGRPRTLYTARLKSR